jgi:hypothetical protein
MGNFEKNFKGRTRADALLSMADKCTAKAINCMMAGDVDLGSFWKHAADGFQARLDELSVAECCEVL